MLVLSVLFLCAVISVLILQSRADESAQLKAPVLATAVKPAETHLDGARVSRESAAAAAKRAIAPSVRTVKSGAEATSEISKPTHTNPAAVAISPISAEDFQYLQLQTDCRYAPRTAAQMLDDSSNLERAHFYWSTAMRERFLQSDAAVLELIALCAAFDTREKALSQTQTQARYSRLQRGDLQSYPEQAVAVVEAQRDMQIEAGSRAALLYRARMEMRSFLISGRETRAIKALRDFRTLALLGENLTALDVKQRIMLQQILLPQWALMAEAQARQLQIQMTQAPRLNNGRRR